MENLRNNAAASLRSGTNVVRISGTTAQPAVTTPLIFVTGASRSGTTMLARMLGAHSAIMTLNELHYFGSLWDPDDADRRFSARELSELAAVLLARQNKGLWGERPTEVERAWGRRLVRRLPTADCTAAGLYAAVLRRLSEDARKTFACEQTPRNIFYASRLLELYPQARVVHIVRDPRAVLASQKNRWRVRKLGAAHMPFREMLRSRVNYHPLTMSQLWNRATEQAQRLESHPRVLLLRFEDLAEDPAAGARRLCAFLGLKYEPEMLEVPRWGSSNLEHSSSSLGVSRDVLEKWRGELSVGETLIGEKVCHRMMQRFGYTPEVLDQRDTWTSFASLLAYPLHVAAVVSLNPRRSWVQLRAVIRSRQSRP